MEKQKEGGSGNGDRRREEEGEAAEADQDWQGTQHESCGVKRDTFIETKT